MLTSNRTKQFWQLSKLTFNLLALTSPREWLPLSRDGFLRVLMQLTQQNKCFSAGVQKLQQKLMEVTSGKAPILVLKQLWLQFWTTKWVWSQQPNTAFTQDLSKLPMSANTDSWTVKLLLIKFRTSGTERTSLPWDSNNQAMSDSLRRNFSRLQQTEFNSRLTWTRTTSKFTMTGLSTSTHTLMFVKQMFQWAT